MSREYLKPETIHHDETGPPAEFDRLSPDHIRNPEMWSNEALFTMITLGHPRSSKFQDILKLRAMYDDSQADLLLRTLQKEGTKP